MSLTTWLLLAAAFAVLLAVRWLRKQAAPLPAQPPAPERPHLVATAQPATTPTLPKPRRPRPPPPTAADDAARDAWESGSIHLMQAALALKPGAVHRHFLLQELVQQTYRRRKEPAMAELCRSTAETYLAELPSIFKGLYAEMPFPVHMGVFQHFATLLTEQGEFARAIQVCELALSKGLHDGTKSGFEGRIERIRKAGIKAGAMPPGPPPPISEATMNQRRHYAVERFFNVRVPGWEQAGMQQVSPTQAVEALWLLNALFQPHLAQIKALPYSAPHEGAADKALERLAHGDSWDFKSPAPIVWRVLLERHSQLITMLMLQEREGVAVVASVPAATPPALLPAALALLLGHSMVLPFPPGASHGPSAHAPAQPGSGLRH